MTTKIFKILLLINLGTLITCPWLPAVSGYSTADSNNGYAGVFGKPITALRVSGGKKYQVHILGGKWLSCVTGNNQNDSSNGYSGNGKTIDGIAITGTRYRVHLQGGGWLPEVSQHNIQDSANGMAGSYGTPIDAVMIYGRTYAVSYGSIGGGSTTPTQDDDVPQSSSKRDKFISCVKAQVGKPYVWAATGPDSFDCSGLVYYCFNYQIGRDTYTQIAGGKAVSSPQAGDLMFYDTDGSGTAGHVTVCMGNGQMIHAPQPGENVKWANYNTDYWVTRYLGARRYW